MNLGSVITKKATADSGNITFTDAISAIDSYEFAVITAHDNVAIGLAAGWTLLYDTTNGGTLHGVVAYRYVAAGETATHVFTHSGGSNIAGFILRIYSAPVNSLKNTSVKVNLAGAGALYTGIAYNATAEALLVAFLHRENVSLPNTSIDFPALPSPLGWVDGQGRVTISSAYAELGIEFGVPGNTGAGTDATVTENNIAVLISVEYPSSPPEPPSLLTAACNMPPFPEARFTASPSFGEAPLTAAFTDTSYGNPTAWAWEFGDGQTSTSQNPSHEYTVPGTYTVRLAVTNAQGASETTRKITVLIAGAPDLQLVPPHTAFTASPMIGQPPLTVSFTDASTDSPASWHWDFGDGQTSTSQNPSHEYTAAGQYIVTLTATNAQGSSSAVKVIIISSDPDPADNPPTATIIADSTTVYGEGAVNFSATLSTPDVFYTWDFGDGSPVSTQAAPSHVFTMPGTYTVSLTVRNLYGQSTAQITVVVVGVTHFGRSAAGKHYIVDKGNDRVLVYDENGTYIGWFGGRGSSAGKLVSPQQITVVRPKFD